MTIQHHQELWDVLDHCMQDTTSRLGGIQLQQETAALSDDTCTVHTILEGSHRAVVVLCADTALITRLARRIMQQDLVTAQDVEDVALEYFNVICGRIAAGLFQKAHISSRFQAPQFRIGPYRPDELLPNHCVRNYTDDNHESAHLIFMHLLPPESNGVSTPSSCQ